MRARALVVVLAACSEEPRFPADYAASFTEVRDCRNSSEHDLHRIRVLADPAALVPYTQRMTGFPEGALLVKEEYDFGDTSCDGPILQWAVMSKHASGPLGWTWQKVDADRNVVSSDSVRCTTCHTDCGVEPGGYDGTCTVP